MSNPIFKQLCLQRLRLRLGSNARLGKTAPEQSDNSLITPKMGKTDGPDNRIFAHGLHEIVAANGSHHAAALAFGLMAVRAMPNALPLLIASLAYQDQDDSRLYGAGIAAIGIDPSRIVEVHARSEKECLWALEEGASCPGLGAVIAILDRKERLYGFTASRRLKLRQEKSGVPVFVVRRAHCEATAATTRWLVKTMPSAIENAASGRLPHLGMPRATAELVRYLGSPPQTWEIAFDASYGLRHVAEVQDGSPAAPANVFGQVA